MARSIFSSGILYSRALSTAALRTGEFLSPWACLAAVEISLANFEKIFDFCASVFSFCRLILLHLLCPDIRVISFVNPLGQLCPNACSRSRSACGRGECARGGRAG